jgi:hypothetical protein
MHASQDVDVFKVAKGENRYKQYFKMALIKYSIMVLLEIMDKEIAEYKIEFLGTVFHISAYF